MNNLQKQFEATGYASWINSELYPDGQIYTKEYTEWLERQLQTKQSEHQNEKIIQAIAAYLMQDGGRIIDNEYNFRYDSGNEELSINEFVVKTASELAAAIAPHLEAGAGWEDAPEWAEWRIEYSDGSHNFSRGYPGIITTGVVKVECRP